MNSSEILHIAENLFFEAMNAKSYLQVLQQLRKNSDMYNREINNSPAFYNVVYNSLIESLFLNLFKLYDRNSKSLTIQVLLKEMQEIVEDDLASDTLEILKKHNNKVPYRLSKEEEVQFPKEVERIKNISMCEGITYSYTTVFLNLQDAVNLYARRFRSLKKSVENLRERRIKIGAHNDSMTNFDYKIITEKFSMTDSEIEKLVEFAVDFLQFCIEVLTGVHKVTEYLNIDDWEYTLNLVRDGMEYRKIQKKQ